jgi:alkanesulfonate monooxygenase SsuD/methylene tetrahydromethanopterin reductase-like flavin-dependent oxidoreductase (luciferase family)
MHIGVSDTVGPADEIRDQAELAAALGYEAFWTQELIDVKDGITTATALAVWEYDLPIRVGLPSPYTRHPAMIATEVASVVDYAAEGAVRSLSLGTSAPEVLRKLGEKLDRPVRTMSETCDVLRAIMRDGRCDYQGEVLELTNWKLRADLPELELILAGMGPKMQELATAKFDGLWLPFNAPVPFCRSVVSDARERLSERFDRDPDDFVFALNIPTAVVDDSAPEDREAQLEAVVRFTAWHCCSDHIKPLVERAGVEYDIRDLRSAVRSGDYGAIRAIVDDEMLDAVAAVGSPEHVRDRYREYVEAGIEYPVVYNYGPASVKRRNVEALAPDAF